MHLMFGFDLKFTTDKCGEVTFKHTPTVYEIIDFIRNNRSDHGTVCIVVNELFFDDPNVFPRIRPVVEQLVEYHDGVCEYDLSDDKLVPLLKCHDAHVDRAFFHEDEKGCVHYLLILKQGVPFHE